jgi:hypothetical protein
VKMLFGRCGRCWRKSGDSNRFLASRLADTECMIGKTVTVTIFRGHSLTKAGIFIGIGDEALALPEMDENRSVCASIGPVVRPVEGRTTGSADYKSAIPVKVFSKETTHY